MGSNGANHLEEFRRSNGDISPKVSPYDEKLGMPTEQSAVVKTKLPMERFQQSGFLVNPDMEAQQGEEGILDRLSISGDQPEPGNLESSKNFVEGPEFEFLDVVKTQSLEEKGKQSSVVEHEQPDTEYQPVEERVVHEIDVNDDQSVSGHHDFIVEDKEDTFDSNGCFCKDKNELDADKEVNVNFVSEGRYSSSSARQISASELSGLEEWSAGFPSIGLDHCSTAPIGAIGADRNSLLESHPVALYKSKTQKEKLTPDLKLDRLSEREKKKLIVNLVKIQKDGTVEVDLEKNDTVASDLLELQSIEREPLCFEEAPMVHKSIPRLTIAILVVGTRGDVQPFLAMAKRLQEFGHRVRLATHTNFREFVKSAGVEFYPLGGDPRVLAGYMARNKGFIPSAPGEISIQRKQLKAIIESLLPACTESDVETGASFRAQAIIANPPAYGHAHVAEALGIPLHMFFTMPWTPTYEFPHPLARVPQSAGNWLSYMVVDLLIWWGIRSYINDFRKRKLKLPPIAYFSMYYGSISHYPTGYMWSPHVVPKPEDWGPSVDVVGYCFLNLGSKYQPRQDFAEWIQKGSKPLYIGFGSMPLEDPRKTTSIILEALKITGQRGILDRGWGDLGAFSEVPDNIFLLENCPHDWLFPQCFAVVHHGGAGTTATGLKAGCPTTIVPFFGDQFFWADRIYQKGLGPEPIPIAQLSVESLSNAITFMLEPEVKSRVMEVAKLIENEDGVATAVDAFHRHLPAEMPTPLVPVLEDYGSHPIQRFFTKIGLLCCLPCS